MTVYGYVGVGIDDDTSIASIRGNGKTMCMTYYLYASQQEGQTVFTNYKTTFCEYMSVDNMIDMFLKKGSTFRNISLGIDELQEYIDSLGGNVKQLKLFMKMMRQLRKRWAHLHWTSQRYMDVAKRARKQTDRVILPVKTHINKAPCFVDMCLEPEHLIWVYLNKPYYPLPLKIIFASHVGALYNSDEVILDEIHVKSEKVDTIKA